MNDLEVIDMFKKFLSRHAPILELTNIAIIRKKQHFRLFGGAENQRKKRAIAPLWAVCCIYIQMTDSVSVFLPVAWGRAVGQAEGDKATDGSARRWGRLLPGEIGGWGSRRWGADSCYVADKLGVVSVGRSVAMVGGGLGGIALWRLEKSGGCGGVRQVV